MSINVKSHGREQIVELSPFNENGGRSICGEWSGWRIEHDLVQFRMHKFPQKDGVMGGPWCQIGLLREMFDKSLEGLKHSVKVIVPLRVFLKKSDLLLMH